MSSALSAAELSVLFKGDATGLQQILSQAEAGVDRFGSHATASMRAVAGSTAAVEAGFGKVGLSSRQMSAAMRGLPAQFTDIFVSLQGGQNPMTVFLQQGGQLKDMFGGVGVAARAMAGYVASMVNPFTVGAAAVGVAAVAAYKGSAEFQALNKSLIMIGGTAGVSADQLMTMAAGIDAMSDNITQSGAVDALNDIVGAGVRGEAQIKRYTLAAAEFEVAGGGAASKVAEQFAELGRDPLQASAKLTQSMGYLTAETYKQIKALEDQGRMLDAAKVAQDAYASALESRAPALVQNLGLIERGWLWVKNGAKEAWDAMLNIGRQATLSDQIAEVEKRLAAARGHKTLGSGLGFDAYDPRTSADTVLLESLKEQQRLSARSAELAATRAQSEKDAVAWMQQGEKYLSSAARIEKEVAKARELGRAAGVSQVEIERRVAEIRESGAKSNKAAAREAEKARKAFGELYNRLTAKDVGLDPDFYEDLNTLHKGYQAGKITLEEYRGAVETLITTQKFAKDAADEARKANIAAGESNNAAFDEVFNAREKERLAVEARIKSGREMLEDLQFETQLLGMNTQQREVAIAMRELERQGVVAGTEAYRAYADQIQRAIADKQQTQKMVDMWSDFEGAARDVFMDIAENGSDAFKRIGQSIKREVLQTLYEMTVKKWIIQVAGSYGGGISGGGTNWIDMASQAYSAYTGGGSAAISAGAGTVNTTTLSGVSAASAGSTGVAGGSASAGSGAAASGSTSLAAYAGYAALIWAAVQYADKLYGEGYNRNMLGDGQAERYRWGYGNTTSGYTDNAGYDYTPYKYRRQMMEAMGMSEKWADIFSSTTRWAHMFGRKLKSYGYDIGIDGGNVSVGGYEQYKSGWAGKLMGRGDKNFGVAIDARNAEMVRQEVESIRNGSRAMAQAMGLSGEAIDAYTGKLRVNFKGANTAAEQSERMAKAMDDLQFSMIKAASGGKMARAEFDRMMESVRADIDAAGISVSGMADILVAGMTGRLSSAEVGDQLASMIVGGIYNSIASQYAGMIANAFMTQIITPIFTAIAAGVPISQAISQAAIQNVVATAQSAAQALNAIFADAGFQAAINGISGAIGQVANISVAPAKHVKSFGSAVSAAGKAAQERFGLETKLLELLGNTGKLRARELATLSPGNRALQKRIWALEDARGAMDSAYESLQRAVDAERDAIEARLETARETESALNDVFGLLRENIRDLRGEIESTAVMQAEQARALIRQAIATGQLPTADTLGDAVDAARNGLSTARYASATARDRAALILANELETLQKIAQPQLSAAEQAVVLMEQQLEGLDLQLKAAEDQMNALLGIDTSVKSVSGAIVALNASMAGYSATVAQAAAMAFMSAAPSSGSSGGGYSLGGGASASRAWTASGYWDKNPDIRAYYTSNADFLNRQFGGRDKYLEWHWQNNGQAEKRKFAAGGAFTNGIVHSPTFFDIGQMGEVGSEAIMPLANVGGRLGVHATGGDAETKALLRELIREVRDARAEGQATAMHTSKMKDVLERVSQRGNAFAVKTLDGVPLATLEAAP